MEWRGDAPDRVPEVEALLFDVFGTVVDWRTSMVAQIRRLCRDFDLDIDPVELVDAWRGEYGPSMDRVLRGESEYANLDTLHARSLETLLGDRGIRPDRVLVDRMVRCWHRLEPWPDVVDGLRRLRGCYLVATMSNGNVALLVELSKHAGLDWDAILSAELASTYKKDLGSFTHCVGLLGRSVEQAMMVSAHPGELAAVDTLGMKTALVHRPWEHGDYRLAPAVPEHTPDVVCHGFDELAVALGV